MVLYHHHFLLPLLLLPLLLLPLPFLLPLLLLPLLLLPLLLLPLTFFLPVLLPLLLLPLPVLLSLPLLLPLLFNVKKFYVLLRGCNCVICNDLKRNSDYFPIQHLLVKTREHHILLYISNLWIR